MTKTFSFTKKVIAVMLVLILAATSNMVAFAAADDTQNAPRSIYGEVVNPLYMDAQPSEDAEKNINGLYSAEVKYSSAYDENQRKALAKTVRDGMIARISPIPMAINTNRTDIDAIIPEIVKLALSEELADTSSAGDYLAWNYSGYRYTGSVLTTDSGYEYNINLYVDYYTTANEEAQVTARINDALRGMNVNSLSEYDKIKNIYDYVCRVCNYDYSTNYNALKFSAYAAVVKGTAVCQGYCTLLYKMLKEAGIDNRIITSSSHSWNIAKIGNNYYNLDATWDDSNYDSGIEYSYFLKCNNHFGDHNSQPQYTDWAFTSRYPIANECYTNCGAQSRTAPPVARVTVGTPTPQSNNAGTPAAQSNTPQQTVVVQKTTTTTTQTTTVKQTTTQKTTAKVTVGNTKIKSVTKKSKGFTVKWNKVANANGYEIQYSTSKKFTKSTTKSVVIKKNSTTSKAVSKLKGNKNYYIRIRAYKNSNGKKYYSSWTTVKNVKTKK